MGQKGCRSAACTTAVPLSPLINLRTCAFRFFLLCVMFNRSGEIVLDPPAEELRAQHFYAATKAQEFTFELSVEDDIDAEHDSILLISDDLL